MGVRTAGQSFFAALEARIAALEAHAELGDEYLMVTGSPGTGTGTGTTHVINGGFAAAQTPVYNWTAPYDARIVLARLYCPVANSATAGTVQWRAIVSGPVDGPATHNLVVQNIPTAREVSGPLSIPLPVGCLVRIESAKTSVVGTINSAVMLMLMLRKGLP